MLGLGACTQASLLNPHAGAGGAAGPGTGSGSGGGGSASALGINPSALVSNGGISSGPGIVMHVTIGEPGSGSLQQGTGVKARVGVQGALSTP
jgi:hypothetical protein